MQHEVTPERIRQLGLGFWASKTLLSAVELGVFTYLADGPKTLPEVLGEFGLHPRSAVDFLDALVSLGMLDRDEEGYRNTAETDLFLDRNKPSYVGGLLEMANSRLYPHWAHLTEALRTGEPQNEAKDGGDLFDVVYSDPDRLRQFLSAMTGSSMGAGMALAQAFPWKDYSTFVDLGCAQGGVAVQLAKAHPHLTGGGFDLPPVGPIFEDYVAAHGLSDRLTFHAGDFFAEDELPTADVLVMGRVLHDWSFEKKFELLGKAYDALPDGGALIVYESLIDDDRRTNSFGLLMSLNMLIETQGGFDFTGADCCGWMTIVGFSETRVQHLVGPESMVIGIK